MLPAPEYTQHLNSEHAVSCSWYRLKHIEVKKWDFCNLGGFFVCLENGGRACGYQSYSAQGHSKNQFCELRSCLVVVMFTWSRQYMVTDIFWASGIWKIAAFKYKIMLLDREGNGNGPQYPKVAPKFSS